MLAFLGAALVGLVAPSGCVMSPEGGYSSREAIEGILFGPDDFGPNGGCECGASCDDLAHDSCAADGEHVECPPRRKLWQRLPKLHLYEPEAGIFNFCIPPQCINPPSPLPPGRFFPVPVRPAFAPRADSGYELLRGSGDPSSDDPPRASAPCQ